MQHLFSLDVPSLHVIGPFASGAQGNNVAIREAIYIEAIYIDKVRTDRVDL